MAGGDVDAGVGRVVKSPDEEAVDEESADVETQYSITGGSGGCPVGSGAGHGDSDPPHHGFVKVAASEKAPQQPRVGGTLVPDLHENLRRLYQGSDPLPAADVAQLLVDNFHVLYLTPCHATPGYSHLNRNVTLHGLDCSPAHACRAT